MEGGGWREWRVEGGEGRGRGGGGEWEEGWWGLGTRRVREAAGELEEASMKTKVRYDNTYSSTRVSGLVRERRVYSQHELR